MTLIPLPNRFVAVDSDSQTVLSYALTTDPAPLTISRAGLPVTGSVELVVTNATDDTVSVASIMLSVPVGKDGSDLMQTADGATCAVSDDTWTFGSSDGEAGEAYFTLEPAVGDTVDLAAGASVVAQIYGFETVPAPGSASVTIDEEVTSAGPGSATFAVTTFPTGFYFDSLVATIPVGSTPTPVAQVGLNTPVTLSWRASVADVSSITVLFSSATGGQQSKP